jgi:hypothetical protein
LCCAMTYFAAPECSSRPAARPRHPSPPRLVRLPCVPSVDVPGMYYLGKVLRPDNEHKNSLVLRFADDNRRYWFPARDVRSWLSSQRRRGVPIGTGELRRAARRLRCSAPDGGHQPRASPAACRLQAGAVCGGAGQRLCCPGSELHVAALGGEQGLRTAAGSVGRNIWPRVSAAAQPAAGINCDWLAPGDAFCWRNQRGPAALCPNGPQAPLAAPIVTTCLHFSRYI